MDSGLWLAVVVVALGGGAVFSALAQALRDLSRTTLEEIAAIRNKRRKARWVDAIVDDVDGHANAIALPRIVCNLVVVVAMVLWIAGLRGVAPAWFERIVGVASASLLLWIFNVVLPAAVARHAGEVTVYTWSGLLRATWYLTRPLHPIWTLFDEIIRRLSGRTKEDEAEAYQEEILSAVEDAQEEGRFDEIERDMIEAVVRFRDKTVGQVMTPRTEIEAMELSNNLGQVADTIRSIGHSRIPVYEENIDHIIGIFYVKDLMRWLAGDGTGRTGRTFDLKALLRPALFVPESKTLRELLAELLAKRVHIAIVADEYGGTAGLVTIEDIVEEVFGDIQDEYEQPDEEGPEVTVEADSRAADVDARAYIDDVNDALRPLGVELPESEDYDTVGGFVTSTLGRIPVAGESFRHGEAMITVLEAEPVRVVRVRVEAAAGPEQPQDPVENEASRAG